MNAYDLIRRIEREAPLSNASEWDNSGVQVAGKIQDISKAALTIEPTSEAVERCLDAGADFILTHHPLYMKPRALNEDGPFLEVVSMLLSRGAWLYSAHTSLDTAPDGPAFWLGQELALAKTSILEPTASFTPIKVSFHVDEPLDRETAEAWAGREGVLSISQDRNQFVRIVCEPGQWPALSNAIVFHLGGKPEFFIKKYESPRTSVGFGSVGDLPESMDVRTFVAMLKDLTGRTTVALSGPTPERIRRVAYCGGSGGGMIPTAFARGADVFVTGDVKYHQAMEAEGLVIDVGHFSLEEEMVRRFANILSESLKDQRVEVAFLPGRDPYAFA